MNHAQIDTLISFRWCLLTLTEHRVCSILTGLFTVKYFKTACEEVATIPHTYITYDADIGKVTIL